MPPAPSRFPPVVRLRPGGLRQRRWPLLLSFSLLLSAALGCRPQPGPRPPAPSTPAAADSLRTEQQLNRKQLAERQCRQQRQELIEGLAELRRAEAALAEQRAALPPPLPAAPIWDEATEQRYSQADQELDRQRYEQELEAWQRRRAEDQAVRAAQRQRQGEAQRRLDRQARLLQQRYPGLFTAPGSIEVRPQELERLSRCPAATG